MEEDTKSSSSCRDGCERVAWASVVAATLSIVGVVLVVTFLGFSKSPAQSLFERTYIADSVTTWFSWLEIAAYVGLVLMASLILLLLSMGCMATGYQNASSWCSFNKAQTGRRQLTAFMIVTYIINLGWYAIFIGSTLPTIFLYMVDRGMCSNTVYTTSTCLDLRQFGLAPQCLPSCSGANSTTHLICGTDLVAICSSKLLTNFFLTLIGCVLVLLGMNHFLMSLSGNYNWLRIRKRRQKLQASKIMRRTGHYDINIAENNEMFSNNTTAERQLSSDSGNTHLRRVNFQSGSTSNVQASSTDSIPTVAAHVPLSFTVPPAATAASSSSTRRSKSPVDVASTTSSQRSTKIYNQTYGLQQDAIRHQQQHQQQHTRSQNRVNFADTHDRKTAATTWSFSNANPVSRSPTGPTRSSTDDAQRTRPSTNAAPTTQSPSTTEATRQPTAATNQNNLNTDIGRDAGTGIGSNSRFDHFNPAYDENYWDHPDSSSQLHQPLQSPKDSRSSDEYYYSRAYRTNAQTSSNAQTAASYYGGGGNYNQGYYNYDYDVADGSAGFEMKPRSSYGQDNSSKSSYGQDNASKLSNDQENSLQRNRTPIGHNFFEYQL